MDAYRERLAVGDRRGAFAATVRGAGGAPPSLKRMPLPQCTCELIAGLDHTAPDVKAPAVVAERARHHLRGPGPRS
jgi:hypothetical protein